MKILYIPSGYTRIYHYLDQSIINAWKTIESVKILNVSSPKKIVTLKRVIQVEKPDVIMTLLGDHLTIPFLEWMNNLSIPTILWLTEDPYYIDRSLLHIPYFKYIFTIDTGALSLYKDRNIQNVHLLPLGTNPEIYQKLPENKRYFRDLCMVGYPYPDRINLANLLLNKTNYTINLVGPLWDKHIPPSLQTTFYKKWVYPKDVASFYSNCKIVLNTYRSSHEKSNKNSLFIENRSINNRTFDIASCHAFQLTQPIEGLDNIFEEKKEIITYQTDDELLSKIDIYINNDFLRETISGAAHKKVIQNHTFQHRIEEILKVIKGNTKV